MGLLESAFKPKPKDGKMIVLYGPEGAGKTTIAAQFPKPFFLRTEDGTESVTKYDITTLDVCKTIDDVRAQFKAIRDEDHEFKTLVVDSITALNEIFESLLIDQSAVKNLADACGGYKKGYDELAIMHRGFCKSMRDIATKKSMNIVMIGHADVDRINPPDADGYSQYVLRMPEKSRKAYTEDVDCVAFISIKTLATKGKAITTGQRFLMCGQSPAQQSKNRWDIDEPIEIEKDKNPFEQYL